MLSQKEQKNPQVIHILSDIYDSDKVNFVKSISNMIINSGFGNTVMLPKSVLAGSLKRSGSEIIALQADAKNKKSLLAEIKSVMPSSNDPKVRILIHNHEFELSKEIQAICKKNKFYQCNTFFSKPEKETFSRRILGKSKFLYNGINISTISNELRGYFLQNYSPLIENISVVPQELTISKGPVPHERIISLATSWGILDQPSLILLTTEFYGNKIWENHVIELGKTLKNFPADQSVQLVILDGKKENLMRDKFQETITHLGLLNFINPVRECTDFEAAVSIASLYLDLSPSPTENSTILQKCAEQGRLCIAWKHGANIEAFPESLSGNLVEPFNFTVFAQKIREFLLFENNKSKIMEEDAKTYVREKYSCQAVESALFDLYNKTLAKRN